MVELAIYAFVAVFVFFRLYSSLGKASGITFQESYVSPENAGSDTSVRNSQSELQDTPLDSVVEAEALSKVAPVLEEIKERSKAFSIKHFMEGSAGAFELVMRALNQKDLETLSSLLDQNLYSSFVEEIERRNTSGRVCEDVVVSIVSQKIVGAELNGDKASITVKFLTEQINVVRDTSGNVVGGSASTINLVEDTWRFERNVASTGRKWHLAFADMCSVAGAIEHN